jgi:uncharacterized Rmd1/YagE family protein
MVQPLFEGRPAVAVRALFLGRRIDLKGYDGGRRLAPSPLAVSAGRQGAAVLLRYGAVVLFGMEPEEEAAFLAELGPRVKGPFAAPETEDARLRFDRHQPEGPSGDALVVEAPHVERIQVVADVLGKSVVLAHYETQTERVFDRVEPLVTELAAHGGTSRRTRELLAQIGGALAVQHQTVGRVAVGEKPEVLWERPDLERLYLRLEEEYEIGERDAALERRLALIQRTAGTALELIHNRRSLRVEWYIVVLIAAEILLTLYEIFVHPHA